MVITKHRFTLIGIDKVVQELTIKPPEGILQKVGEIFCYYIFVIVTGEKVVCVLVVHAHESRLSINEPDAGVGYGTLYRTMQNHTSTPPSLSFFFPLNIIDILSFHIFNFPYR